ncbi:MAG TPA: pyridoxal phosphate-dependent aminotransferase [Stellaceae bacterium]|nr:pyridoxal phosphate-dependent aminotransferase [Stellaceae bacterium]
MALIRAQIEDLEDSPIIDVWRLGQTVPDVIGLWAGESDLPTPDFICRAAAGALTAGQTFYSHNRGIPSLRAEIIDYHRRHYGITLPDERVAVTSSGMNGVVLVAQAIIDPGDNVVAITPSWPNILRAVTVAGGEIRTVALKSGDAGWQLDIEAVFARCDARTRAIYYASPGNPTGWMIERDQALRLLAFARARGIALIVDEVYHRIVYDRPVALSILEIAEPDDPVFVVHSFSKSWAMTGWRMGWLIYPPAALDAFEKLIQFNTSGGQAFLQAGAIAALRDGEPFVERFVARCREGREVALSRLRAMPRVRVVPNNGSFYFMIDIDGVRDVLQFCKRAVIEARVGLAPGTAFSGGAETHVRLCYAKSPELLHTAMDRLGAFIAQYTEA